MKVLLDENLDHELRKLLGHHDVVATTFMGWSGLRNGQLPLVAEACGIDVLLTGDQTLAYEQNLFNLASDLSARVSIDSRAIYCR